MFTRRGVLAGASVGALATLGGCSFSVGTSSDSTADFGLSNLVFASTEPSGYMEYDEQPDATYDVDDTVWVYVNVDGVSTEPQDDGSKRIWITEELTLTDPDGERLIDGEEVVNSNRNWAAEFDPSKLFLTNDVTLPSGAGPGDYTVELAVTDELAEETATISSTFTAED